MQKVMGGIDRDLVSAPPKMLFDFRWSSTGSAGFLFIEEIVQQSFPRFLCLLFCVFQACGS